MPFCLTDPALSQQTNVVFRLRFPTASLMHAAGPQVVHLAVPSASPDTHLLVYLHATLAFGADRSTVWVGIFSFFVVMHACMCAFSREGSAVLDTHIHLSRFLP